MECAVIAQLLLPLLLLSRPAACCRQRVAFHPILTSNCVSPADYQLLDLDIAACALRCGAAPRCRAFAMEAAAAASDRQLCLLFAFNACRAYDCCSMASSGCSSRRLRVFVKRSEGLEPGRLCPADYRWVSGVSGSSFKGSLYKAAGSGQMANYSAQTNSCRSFLSSSDGSVMRLTKLADLSSVEELQDVRNSTGFSTEDIWVSASMVNDDLWEWADCGWPLPLLNTTSGGVWQASKGSGTYESDKRARIQYFGLNDRSSYHAMLGACECADPFWYFKI